MAQIKPDDFCPDCRAKLQDYLLTETDLIDYPQQYWGGRTWAQHGDDLIILNIFNRLRIERPSYLDIGAHHPYNISNTALLYKRGSRGINVEANPLLIGDFFKYRPEDINLNIGVGPEPGTMIFYCDHPISGRNTFIRKHIEDIGIRGQMDLPVTTLQDIVDTHAKGVFPDLLSLDIEGLEIPVLDVTSFEISKPKVICVEMITKFLAHKDDIKNHLMGCGYFPYCWAGGNMFFVSEDYRDQMY